MDELAPMLVAMTLILTSGAVFLLRPVAKRLGDLLELMAKQRTGELQAPGTERLSQLVEALDSRLGLVEERLDFTDRLLQEGRESPSPVARPRHEDTTE